MKKLVLTLAVLLPLAPLLGAQETVDAGKNLASLEVITKLDLTTSFSPGATTFSLGNTCLYTRLNITPSEHVTLKMFNLWMSYPSITKDVLKEQAMYYTNLGRSDYLNWLCGLSAIFRFGNWTFDVGKGCIPVDSYEYELLDYEQEIALLSKFWTGVQPYQWGGSARYTTPSKKTSLCLSARTSPYGERPFASGLYTYGAEWRGKYGWFSNIWQFCAIETEKGKFEPVLSLGQKATFGRFSVSFDWLNKLGDYYLILLPGNTFILNGTYDDNDDWVVRTIGIYETGSGMKGFKAGATVEYYPLPEARRNLKLSLCVAYNSFLNAPITALACTYILKYNFKRK